MPTSSRMVSALCSIIDRPSSSTSSNGWMLPVEVRHAGRSRERAQPGAAGSSTGSASAAARPHRPPLRVRPCRSCRSWRFALSCGGIVGATVPRIGGRVGRRRWSIAVRAGSVTTVPRCGYGAVVCGKPIASTNSSWKRGSVAVSIFSTRRTTSSISSRAAAESRARTAPAPAALPTDAHPFDRRSRGSGRAPSRSTGSMWAPNAPARRIVVDRRRRRRAPISRSIAGAQRGLGQLDRAHVVLGDGAVGRPSPSCERRRRTCGRWRRSGGCARRSSPWIAPSVVDDAGEVQLADRPR